MNRFPPQPPSELYLPSNISQSLSDIVRSGRGAGPPPHPDQQDGPSTIMQLQLDFNDSRQWVELRSINGDMVVYYDYATREFWIPNSGNDSGSQMDIAEDRQQEENPGIHGATPQLPPAGNFDDDEINAADHLVRVLSSEEQATYFQSQPPNGQSSWRPGPSAAPSSQPSPVPTQLDLAGRDPDPQPYPSTAKGKQRANPEARISDNEVSSDDEMVGGGATPTPYSDRPVTVKDMHRICDSILTGQRDMAQMIIDGLRPQLGRSVGSNLGDAGNDGDVEGGYSEPKRREGNRTKRRDHLENELSRKIRVHLSKLVTPDNLFKNTVTKQEVDAFNPNLGPCCYPSNFRVHLEGTTCDKWNKSAVAVFVEDFLRVHPEYPSDESAVREMVRIKSRATLDSVIRKYRRSLVSQSAETVEELRKRKNRQERKRKLFNRRQKTMNIYPSLIPHRQLLEQLTPDGMSSDEERIIGLHAQYDIIEPVWRADIVTAWLRILDALYMQARIHGLLGNQHSSIPRTRVSSGKQSTSGKFVSGLPRNAYDDVWFESQPHTEYTVQPGLPARYIHTARTLE